MNPPPIGYRRATRRDREWLLAVRRAAMREYVEAMFGWDEQAQRRWTEEECPLAHVKIVQVDGRDAGMLQVEEHPDHVFLANIQLLPEFQRLGVGSRVVSAVVDAAAAKNKPVLLQVLRVNPARSLYERLGFSVYEETPTHYKMKK